MSRISLEFALPEARAAQRAFDHAAATFSAASVVHDEARERLLGRLDYFRLEPSAIADLGCGTGDGARQLQARYPAARVLGIDTSLAMLHAARARGAAHDAVGLIAGDAQRLPVASAAVELILANMVLPWCAPDRVFGEAARALSEGGLLLFATLGPDTLQEVRRAWAGVDDRVHVHALFDMHDLGDLAVASGLAEPVMDVDRMELTYTEPAGLVSDLRSCGAVNVAAGRRPALTGRGRWARFEQALTAGRRDDGRFPVTVELIFGHAWGTGRGRAPRRDASGETAVPVENIGTLRRR